MAMRIVKILDLVFIACLLIGFAIYLLLSASDNQSEDYRLAAIDAGRVQPASLVVVDKYSPGGKSKAYYVELSDGISPDFARSVSKRQYDALNKGDRFAGYFFGSEYFVPAFDDERFLPRAGLITIITIFFIALLALLAAYRIHRYGKILGNKT